MLLYIYEFKLELDALSFENKVMCFPGTNWYTDHLPTPVRKTKVSMSMWSVILYYIIRSTSKAMSTLQCHLYRWKSQLH